MLISMTPKFRGKDRKIRPPIEINQLCNVVSHLIACIFVVSADQTEKAKDVIIGVHINKGV